MNLMYLAEREYVSRYDFPMLFDKLIAMKNGPDLSDTLNLMTGEEGSSVWSEFVKDRENHDIEIAKHEPSILDLDELSDSEIEALQDTWSKFRNFDKWALRDYTHGNCPKWENPGESRSCRLLFKPGENQQF